MTNQQREKDNLKHSPTIEVNLVKLPPKWKIKQTDGYFEYYDGNNDMHFCNTKDNNITRMYCWAVYNKIERK